jgi:hypothetical protein
VENGAPLKNMINNHTPQKKKGIVINLKQTMNFVKEGRYKI